MCRSTLTDVRTDRFNVSITRGAIVTYPVRPSHGNVEMREGIVRGFTDKGALILTALYNWKDYTTGRRVFNRGKFVKIKNLDRVTVTQHTEYSLGLTR